MPRARCARPCIASCNSLEKYVCSAHVIVADVTVAGQEKVVNAAGDASITVYVSKHVKELLLTAHTKCDITPIDQLAEFMVAAKVMASMHAHTCA